MSGLATLLYKELLRFWKVAFQTVAAPVLTTLLYLLIFSHVMQARVEKFPIFVLSALLPWNFFAQSVTGGAMHVDVERPDSNAIEAAARGASDGMGLLLNICAMLIAFVALMWMANGVLGVLGSILAAIGVDGAAGLSLQFA